MGSPVNPPFLKGGLLPPGGMPRPTAEQISRERFFQTGPVVHFEGRPQLDLNQVLGSLTEVLEDEQAIASLDPEDLQRFADNLQQMARASGLREGWQDLERTAREAGYRARIHHTAVSESAHELGDELVHGDWQDPADIPLNKREYRPGFYRVVPLAKLRAEGLRKVTPEEMGEFRMQG